MPLLTFSRILSLSANVTLFLDSEIVFSFAFHPVEILFSSHARIATPLAVPTYPNSGVKSIVVFAIPFFPIVFRPLLSLLSLYTPTLLPAVSYSVYWLSRYSVVLFNGFVTLTAVPSSFPLASRITTSVPL